MAENPARSRDFLITTSAKPNVSTQCIQQERLPSSFKFLGLPKELRLMVYDQLPRLAYRKFSTPDYTILWKDWIYESAIIRTSREIHDEASANINRRVSKPIPTQFLLPNFRSLKALTSIFDTVHGPTNGVTVNSVKPASSHNPLKIHSVDYETTCVQRIRACLHSTDVIEIRVQIGPFNRVVDPEMYINNFHSSILLLDRCVARHSNLQVEVILMSLRDDDEELIEQARTHIEPATVALKWVSVVPRKVESLWNIGIGAA